MKLYWTGTDSLMLVDYSMRKWIKKPYWFAFRVLIRIMDFFIQEHYCISDNIANNVKKFGTRNPVTVVATNVWYPSKMKKKEHKKFNVIYYNPKNRKDKDFTRWLYGLDIIEEVKARLPGVNFIELDGSSDMKNIYPYADCLIRPNRHDGPSRMRMECYINEIPYYWTQSDPSVEDCITFIKQQHEHKTSTRKFRKKV